MIKADIHMNNAPLISVLLPTFNVEDYIEAAVESILNQTMSNFELIIVDDCSTDSTYTKLQNLASQDERIRLFRNESNLRISKTLNFALSKARGIYIARMDGDDISREDRLEKLFNYLEQNPSISLVGNFTIAISSTGKKLACRRQPKSDKWISLTLPLCSTVFHAWMARKSLYDDLNGYRNVPGAEDYDFLLRAKKANYLLANYPDYLYMQRLREGNTESDQGLKRFLIKEYVFRINKTGEELDEEALAKLLKVDEKEKLKYKTASSILDMAKHERDAPVKLIKDALKAALTSRHIAKYLYEVTAVRFAIKLEDIGFLKGK